MSNKIIKATLTIEIPIEGKTMEELFAKMLTIQDEPIGQYYKNHKLENDNN